MTPKRSPAAARKPPAGDLREAFIRAALELLHDGGIQGLTLRKTAARAGVSHAAPAYHFDGLDGLLTAVAARAYSIFAQTMQAATDMAGPGDFEKLLGICQGYLDFAARHEGLFVLMFNTPNLRRDDPDLSAASAEAYEILRRSCAPYATEPGDEVELGVWSLVHGYATLGFNKPIGAGRAFRSVPPFERLLRRLILR